MQHAKALAEIQVRPSRIQVEVREIPVVKQSIVSRYDVDGDSGDIRNE